MPASRLYLVLRLRREKGWLSVLSARALRVDDVLLEHYNWRQGRAWPGYETLCRDAGLGKDAIGEALRELEFYRRWVIERRPRRPNIYCLPHDLVPDVPAARYVPSARWTRKERLAGLRVGASSERVVSRASSRMKSRASQSLQSRASRGYGRDAPVRNYAVELRSMNNAVELRDGNNYFQSHQKDHSPNGEEPCREAAVLRYSPLWEELKNSPEARDGVARALAAALRCSESEARMFLLGGN